MQLSLNGRKLCKRLNYGNVEQQFELSDTVMAFFKGKGGYLDRYLLSFGEAFVTI